MDAGSTTSTENTPQPNLETPPRVERVSFRYIDIKIKFSILPNFHNSLRNRKALEDRVKEP